jgi:hypothetical protein
MTAIVRLYIPAEDAFVIAADGLRTHSANPALNNTEGQKIIGLDGIGKRLACSGTGVVQLGADDSDEIVIDLLKEAKTASESLHYRNYKDLHRYATALSDRINGKLDERKRSGNISEYPSPPLLPMETSTTIAELFVDGFYDGVSSRAAIRFHHKDQGLLEPEITDHPLALGKVFVQGPATPGRSVLEAHPLCSLEDGVEAAKEYIRSCSDPESIAIDQAACALIGGHIHVATITKESGFQWAIPPLVEEY